MKTTMFRISTLLLLLVAAAACTGTRTQMGAETVAAPGTASPAATLFVPTPDYKPDLAAIGRNFPKVDGSTTSLPLLRLILCKSVGVSCAWQDYVSPVHKEVTSRMIAPLHYDALPRRVQDAYTALTVNTTHNAVMNLIEGKADLILVANRPSDVEVKAAREKSLELDVRPIALDALVFIVNRENPVSNITIEQARGVFSGKVREWSELKGGKAYIEPYQREDNSGSQELMKALIMKGTLMVNAPDMLITTMMGEVNMVGEKPNALGYSVYYYVTSLLIDSRVKMLAVNGVKPEADTIAHRAYPLAAEFYVVTRQGLPKEHPAAQLRDWLWTDEGQAVVKESGYVPVRQ